MAKHIETEIVIDAAAEHVWQHLVDWERYPEWNPFIRKIEGDLAVGSRLSITVEPVGGKAMDFSPTILVAAEGRELRWLGRLLIPGIFNGEHSFVLEKSPSGQTVFRHCERFSGLLIPLMWSSFGPGTIEGFSQMNEALKTRVEHED